MITLMLDLWISNPIAVIITFLVLIYLDQFLTRVTIRLRQQGYNKFFITDIVEMNPIYRKSIQEDKPIKLRYHLVVILFIAVFVFPLSIVQNPLTRFGLGALLLSLLDTNLDHIQNIHSAWFVKHHPETLKGQIEIDHTYNFMMSRNKVFGMVGLLFFVFLFTGEVFFFGGVCSLGVLIIAMLYWGRSKKDPINENEKKNETE